VYAAYVQLWSLAQLLEWWSGSLTGHGFFEVVQMWFLIGALLRPKTKVFPSLALFSRMVNVLRRAPRAFEMEYVAALMDLPALLCILARHPHKTTLLPSRAIRWQLALTYVATGLWKWNKSFVHPRYSCATVSAMQFLDAWHLRWSNLATGVSLATAPWCSLGLDLAIGICMVLAPSVGALLGLSVHALATLTPPPNNGAAAALVLATRYFWLAPFACTRAWRNAVDYAEFAVHAAVGACFLAVTLRKAPHLDLGGGASSSGDDDLAAATAKSSSEAQQLPPFFADVDWAAGAFGVVASLLTTAAVLQRRPDRRDAATKKREGIVTIVAESSAPAVFWLAVSCTAFYVFGSPLLGLTDTPHPGLRVVGGSNHFLLPTGLLQRWYLNDPTSVFSGGLVRVEESTSRYVNAVHPGDLTPLLSKGAARLLAKYRHIGKTWNSAISSVVGEPALPAFPDLWSGHKKNGWPAFIMRGGKKKKKTTNASSKEKSTGFLGALTNSSVGHAVKAAFSTYDDDESFFSNDLADVIERPLTDRYTVPAYELARVLKQARKRASLSGDESFRIVFARLAGAAGDENWRRHSVSKLVRLDVDASGTNCTVLDRLDPKHDPITRHSVLDSGSTAASSYSNFDHRRDNDNYYAGTPQQQKKGKHPTHPPDANPDATSCAPEDFLDGRTWAVSLVNVLGAKLQAWRSYPVVPRLALTRYERHSDELPCYGT